jgi:hypothetical protein
MIVTLLFGFVAGFFFGNGLPYYLAGSMGDGTNPSPFPDSPFASVVVGWIAMLIGASCWHVVDTQRFGWLAQGAAATGVLVVGLIHARLWRNDPWRKRQGPLGARAGQ